MMHAVMGAPDCSIELAAGVSAHGTDVSWRTEVAAHAMERRSENEEDIR